MNINVIIKAVSKTFLGVVVVMIA